jgi:hypothetical protein
VSSDRKTRANLGASRKSFKPWDAGGGGGAAPKRSIAGIARDRRHRRDRKTGFTAEDAEVAKGNQGQTYANLE